MFNFFKKNKQPKEIPTSNLILSKQNSINLEKEHGNVLVVGCAGSGKTIHFVKPNLLQSHYSYIVTDCGGECYESTSNYFKQSGYEVVVFDLYNPERSAKYNPIEYVYSRRDAECLAKIILGNKEKFDDRFTYNVAVKLLTSLFLLSREIDQEHAFYFRDINLFLNDYEYAMASFEQARKKNIVSEACKEYDSTGILKQHFFDNVARAIQPKLDVFLCERYKDVFCGEDELKLNRTSAKRVLYIIVPPIGGTDSIISAIYAQSILAISGVADMFYKMGREFDHKTVLFMDDFANTICIPDLDVLMGQCKKHICCVPILQSINRLQALYPKSWENILMEIDTTLFMGSTALITTEYISHISHIKEADIRMLPMEKCIVAKIGKIGSIDDKYQLEHHPKMVSLE